MPSIIKSGKVTLLFLLFLCFFLLIIIKLFYIQIISPFSSNSDYLTTHKIPAVRGKIFDKNYQPLATNQITYQLYVEPHKLTQQDTFIRKAAGILKIEEASIEAKLNVSKSKWLPIQSHIDQDSKDKITALDLPGVGFDQEQTRYYPEASLSAHILGFVGKNSKGDNTGYFGVEGFYDQDLAGLPGLLNSERDLVGKPIFFGTQNRIEPENGRDFILTIDSSVQKIVKDKLVAGLDKYGAKSGCVIVANPSTMDILSLVCLPDYDPTTYSLSTEEEFKNSAITDTYEPGSVFKPLIVAAGIESGAIKPNEIFNETGPIKVGEYTIRTWDSKYAGKISMTKILEKSSNVGMVYIGQKLGQNRVYSYVHDYGFGRTTGIDLQGESQGLIKPRADWYPIDYSTVTFGQGLGVTPIQMIRAFSAVINGGNLLVPHVVSQIKSDVDVSKIKPVVVKKILSEKTSSIMRKMLQTTVENGEVKWAKPKGYDMGGKTGTAQIPIQGHYDATKTVASFIGFFPVDKPQVIALVVLRETQSSQWGSETAAPLFFDIAKDLIVYYNIAPNQ